MTLRSRIAASAAVAVAVAVLATSAALYWSTSRALHAAVDQNLERMAAEFTAGGLPTPPAESFGPRAGPMGGAGGFVQLVTAEGRVLRPSGADHEPLPVTDAAVDIAAGAESTIETVRFEDAPLRVLTFPAEPGLAVQIARPLDEVGDALATLRGQLVVGAAVGIALAGGLGMVAARPAIRPVRELTALADDVAASRDLSRRVTVDRDDELGRLAATLNAMLANLEQARHAQQQLVADASHELRTPLTSLRTNVEVLASADRLTDADRARLIDDVTGQLDELARLIADLIELARGEQPVRASAPVRLDRLVEDAVEGLGGRTRPDRFRLDLRPTTVSGEADRLQRMVGNLLDNAVKHGGEPIEVTVADARLEVRDHGPGIAAADLPHVFDRFYRAADARAATGSGLGLSIVRQVAEAHGGDVRAANHADGGAVVTVTLPEA